MENLMFKGDEVGIMAPGNIIIEISFLIKTIL
jgi:hypothetical protein